MRTILLIINIFVAIAMIGVILIQRSEDGGLGIGGGQGMGGFMTGRGTANLLTRTTAVLATIFLALSLVLAILDRGATSGASSVLNGAPPAKHAAPAKPAAPAGPTVPVTPATPAPAPASTSPMAPAPAKPATPAVPVKPATPAAPAKPAPNP